MSVNSEVVFIKDWILEQIDQGKFMKHMPLPSQYEISKILNKSRDDIELAFHELVTEQIISEHFQEGYFIKHKPIFLYPIDELKSITSMIEEAGQVAGTLMISHDIEQPSIDDQRVLKMEERHHITVVERIRTANDEPVVYCLDKINAAPFSGAQEILQHSLLELLGRTERLKVEYAESEIESIAYEPYISNALQCAPEESLLLFKQTHYNAWDEPILYSLNYFKSSQVRFVIKRTKKS
ncbi:GntR family transcriptional regulator [Macrococcoides caseolyticum]|uniref:GntR family transcriptional regulator n=1 Tax=Macrococcoides caseolyticum TaxID=69966 RepID=UPI001F1D45A3|nr:GntR family transcriptional regulator [Macrococcus caseolyticus]MCE4957231.1 GntR family transcriptional regulator [Macrococcus caseolyticus]